MAKFTKVVDKNGDIEVIDCDGYENYIGIAQFGLVDLSPGEYEFEITATKKKTKLEEATNRLYCRIVDNMRRPTREELAEYIKAVGLEVKDENL